MWLPTTAVRLPISCGLVLVSLALLTLFIKPEHFEVDIFTAMPWFWVLIFAAASIFIASIVWQAYCGDYSWFGFSFFGLLLCSLSIFSLPVLRGYFLYGANDPNAHLQYAIKILQTGHIGNDYYPISHIIAAVVAQITTLPPQVSMGLLVPVFSALFSVFIYCLAPIVLGKRERVAIAAAIGFLPFFTYYHIEFYPHGIALLLTPFVFYLLFKSSNDLRFSALLVPVLLLVTFTHPIISIIVVASLFCVVIAERMCRSRGLVKVRHFSWIIGLIGGVVWFGWWTVEGAIGNFSQVIAWLRGETAAIPRINELTPATGQGLLFTIELALKMYGVEVVFLFIALAGAVIVLRRYYRRDSETANAFIVTCVFAVSLLAYTLTFASGGLTTIGRLLGANIGLWPLPLLAALPLVMVSKRKAGVVLVSALIASSFIAGSCATFRSPWISQANQQFTYQDNAAYQWDVLYARKTIAYSEIATSLGRIPSKDWEQIPTQEIPPHFGYENNTTLKDALGNATLILLGEQRQRAVANNAVLSESTLSGSWGISGVTNDDLNKLKNDTSVNQIYVTGDTEMLWVT